MDGHAVTFHAFAIARKANGMALVIKGEELRGLISIPEATAAVRDGFAIKARDLRIPRPAFEFNTRIGASASTPADATGGGGHVHSCREVHLPRWSTQYEKAGKRVYVAYDSEIASRHVHDSSVDRSRPRVQPQRGEPFGFRRPYAATDARTY
jgi:hypothetical protein